MISCEALHIMFPSHQLSWIAERYGMFLISWFEFTYFGFLITLRKLKTSKINLKIEDAWLCTDMPLIDSFLFTAEITVLFVAHRLH